MANALYEPALGRLPKQAERTIAPEILGAKPTAA